MFKRLKNKLLLMNMTITSLVVIGAFVVIYLSTYNNIKTENENKLADITGADIIIQSLNDTKVQTNTPDSIPQMFTVQNKSSENSPPFFVLLMNRKGEVTGVEALLGISDEVCIKAAELVKKSAENEQVDFNGRQWLYSAFPITEEFVGEDGQVIEVEDGSYKVAFLDITDSRKTLQELLITLSFVGITVLIAIFFTSLYFAKRAIAPIADAWERQQQFIADASHELKTPLSIITANHDALLANENETIRSQKQWLDYMKIGTGRMTKLINSLLSLVKAGSTPDETENAPFDLSELAAETIRIMDALRQEKNLTLSQSITPGIIVNSSKDLLDQVLNILYENAVKYADHGGKVDVSLSVQGQKAVCSIRNTGKGIPKQELSKVFDRFYRADPSRTEENGGYGLGLSIAKTAIERLDGSISAESTEGEWTVFSFAVGGVE